MSPGDQYRVKAAEFYELAESTASPSLQLQYATMAASYFRLAEQADLNALTDVSYATPGRIPRRPGYVRRRLVGDKVRIPAWEASSPHAGRASH
jgi:hypothetical protein